MEDAHGAKANVGEVPSSEVFSSVFCFVGSISLWIGLEMVYWSIFNCTF